MGKSGQNKRQEHKKKKHFNLFEILDQMKKILKNQSNGLLLGLKYRLESNIITGFSNCKNIINNYYGNETIQDNSYLTAKSYNITFYSDELDYFFFNPIPDTLDFDPEIQK